MHIIYSDDHRCCLLPTLMSAARAPVEGVEASLLEAQQVEVEIEVELGVEVVEASYIVSAETTNSPIIIPTPFHFSPPATVAAAATDVHADVDVDVDATISHHLERGANMTDPDVGSVARCQEDESPSRSPSRSAPSAIQVFARRVYDASQTAVTNSNFNSGATGNTGQTGQTGANYFLPATASTTVAATNTTTTTNTSGNNNNNNTNTNSNTNSNTNTTETACTRPNPNPNPNPNFIINISNNCEVDDSDSDSDNNDTDNCTSRATGGL